MKLNARTLIGLAAIAAVMLVGQPAAAGGGIYLPPPPPPPQPNWMTCLPTDPAAIGELSEAYNSYNNPTTLYMEGTLIPCHASTSKDAWSFVEYSTDGTATGYWHLYAGSYFRAAVTLKSTTVAVCVATGANLRLHCLSASLVTNNGVVSVHLGSEIPVDSPQVSISATIIPHPPSPNDENGNPTCPTCP